MSTVNVWGDRALDPAVFGAVGDGVADDTAAWQAAMEAAVEGRFVALCGRTYAISEVVLRPGVAGIIGPGTLRGIAPIDTGLIHCGRTVHDGGQVIENVTISLVTIEVAEARCGIEFVGVNDSVVENCRVICSRDLHKGIWLRNASCRNQLRGNTVTAPPGDVLKSLVCVTVESVVSENPYFAGVPGEIEYVETTYGNVLEGNLIEGGTHGVALGVAARTRIVNNLIRGNAHRNINICPASRFNIISQNQLLEAGSSAVAMAYGASDNIVTDNQIASMRTTPDCDRDAIHAYVASCGNRIAGNVIVGNFRYGVYLAAGACGNLVQDNRIRLELNERAVNDWTVGVGLESDWLERPLPAEACFSRQNFGAAPEGFRWAYTDGVENRICGNVIEQASCGFYLAQFGDRGLRGNRVMENRCLPAVARELVVVAQSPELVAGNRIAVDGASIGTERVQVPTSMVVLANG